MNVRSLAQQQPWVRPADEPGDGWPCCISRSCASVIYSVCGSFSSLNNSFTIHTILYRLHKHNCKLSYLMAINKQALYAHECIIYTCYICKRAYLILCHFCWIINCHECIYMFHPCLSIGYIFILYQICEHLYVWTNSYIYNWARRTFSQYLCYLRKFFKLIYIAFIARSAFSFYSKVRPYFCILILIPCSWYSESTPNR